MSLIGPKALAKVLDVPITWVYAGVRNRTLPHIKVGHYVRFDEDDLKAWLTERRRGAHTIQSQPEELVGAGKERHG